MKSWLGRCHLYRGEGADRVDYEALVAVFCAEIEAFDLAVRAHLDGKDMCLLWSEERHPAGEWLARNPAEKHAADLARSVHERHPVEIGTLTKSGEAVGGEAQSYLKIEEHKITPLPDQTGIPFWDKEWIAPDLKELLFGQPKTSETLRTYFIVDAILRKKITKLFDLDTVDVPVKCLFKGDAAVELKEAAPYLIDMTLPNGAWDDKDLVPNFHKDFFEKHWGASTGIFIRSTANMDAIWNHLRKFTRVQVEEDKRWIYFRFWEPSMILYFLKGTDRGNVDAFFHCNFELYTIDDANAFQRVTILNRPSKVAVKTILLKPQDFESFRLYVHMRYYYQLKKWLVREFGNPLEVKDIRTFLRSEIQFAIKLFRTEDKRIIAHYVAASWLLGERAWNNKLVDEKRNIKTNSRGARTLYERAYDYKYKEVSV